MASVYVFLCMLFCFISFLCNTLLVTCEEVILIEMFVVLFHMMCYEWIPENTGHFDYRKSMI